MKKNILITLSLIAILCFSTSIFSFADTAPENIKIDLGKSGNAKVFYKNQSFDISYQIYNNRILVGNGNNQDLLKLLNVASDISNQKYDLTLRNRILSDSFDYDVVITSYQGVKENYGISPLYSSSLFDITKIMEFYSDGAARVDGRPFSFDGSKDAMPHLLFIDGNYQYSLPLKYIFVKLGFTVEYENNTVTITLRE